MKSYIKSPKQIALRFGQKVRRIRKEHGLTETQLAVAAQMTATAIHDVERGMYATDLYEVLQLAMALKISPEKLLPPLIGYSMKGTVTDGHESREVAVGA